MATPSRKPDPDVEKPLDWTLKNEPFKIGFFQAVRLLRRRMPQRKAPGSFVPPAQEAVRFISNPSLAFPAGEIQEIKWPTNAEEPPRMVVNFMGLCSPVGVLPQHYTELIIDRAQNKDNGFRDFLDLFNHRLISLFYRAWEKYRFFVGYERREEDKLTTMLFSLIGLNTAGLAGRQAVHDQSLAFYSGLLAQQPRSAQSLTQILADYFQVDVALEQFVGKWVRLPQNTQTCFDDAESVNTQLGGGAVLGDEVCDHQSSVRIKLGPLTRDQYLDFLPTKTAKAYPALKALLKFFSNDVIDFEIQLILKREETPALKLGASDHSGLMLGWTTWVKNAPMGRDPGETVLQM
jgi:type VI secretion system protein ImpH